MSARRKTVEERLYYSPPAMRKYNQQQQPSKLKPSPPSSLSSPSLLEKRRLESVSNLDRFMEHTVPVVPAQRFSKTSMRAWRNRDTEFHPYFILSDLWESFREWSVYGAGVPLVMKGSDSVVQYYVPSLSGIQLYIDPSRHPTEQSDTRPGEESDANSSRETSSDGDGECGTDRGPTNSRGSLRLSGRNVSSKETSVDGEDISNPPDLLIFEYFERELPFHREPLADKMSVLASRFPDLKTYRSCDLTQSSWISVAWYPIYRIPVGPTLQNLDACFLTFHPLAKPVRSSERGNGGSSKLSLPTFGLVPYKFKVSDWNNSTDEVLERQKVTSLLNAAGNWLRMLQVYHPDYSFFTSHNTYWR